MKYITKMAVGTDRTFVATGLNVEYSQLEKQQLINYLESFAPCLYTSEPVVDIFTGEKVAEADNGFSDGEYTWFVSEIYYFRKYNLLLCEEFIEYVKKRVQMRK